MAVFQPKLEAITTLLSTHRVSVANLLELCSKLNISPFILGKKLSRTVMQGGLVCLVAVSPLIVGNHSKR